MENYKKQNINNELIIKYKIEDNLDNKVRLFGNEFVHNNKKNCKIIIDKEEYELYTHWYKYKVKSNILEIKLKIVKPLINIQGIFSMCNSLIPSFDISNLDTSNVINMRNIFYECSSLLSLPDISKWDTSKVTDMGGMFYGCSSLSLLPDISNWNTSNVNDMSLHFL